jgi:hypothetical protein
MTKDSVPPNASTPTLAEQLRMQRYLQQESRSSAPENAKESDSLSSSGPRSFTAASEELRMQRQIQQESRSSAPENSEESDSLSSSGPRSFTAAPRDSNRTSRSMDNLRTILDRAVAVLDEDNEELEDSVISSRSDDSNTQP